MSLEINNLTVTYNDNGHELLALEEVNLNLRPGRITALVGESGSGKTTLGLALLGLLPENARVTGEIRTGLTDVTELDETSLNEMRWAKMAMVFQTGAAAFNPVKKILNQAAEPLIEKAFEKPEAAREKASQMLDRMGLDREIGQRFPHELSGGQIQRALLAMALILDPEILVLDEPTAALDAMTRSFVASVIMEAKNEGRSILLISHDLDLAANLADDIAVLYLGQIMETMPAKDLLSNPCHPYTLALGRSYPSMNVDRDLGGIRGDAYYRILHNHPDKDKAGAGHVHVHSPGFVHEDGHGPPAGCLFYPRCTQAIDECGQGYIALEKAGDHEVRCLRGGITDLVVLEKVSKKYKQIDALHETNLTLKSGELFCLIGETGSGKTTLAMTAGGVIKPDSGKRFFNSRDMDDWIKRDYRSLAKKVGVVYQNPAQSVSHRFSVGEIISEPLKIYRKEFKKADISEKVKKLLAETRLPPDEAFTQRYPHELNMGALQRVCIARALALEPELLIADEPTSSLDPGVQARVLKMLLDLRIERGLTMLFVTHDIGLARKIGDRIGVMHCGRIVEMGPASQVLSEPLHPYTKMLLKSAGSIEPAALGAKPSETGDGGCSFLPMCPEAIPICRSQAPDALDCRGRLVRCHLAGDHKASIVDIQARRSQVLTI